MIARRTASLCALLLVLAGCMFERYTLAGRRVVAHAIVHARERGAHAIGTEHLLLGVVQEDPDLLSRVGTRARFTLESFQKEVDRVSPRRTVSDVPPVDLPLEPEAKQVLELRPEGHADAGPEDLLLALFTNTGKASTVLRNLGVTEDTLRQEIRAH